MIFLRAQAACDDIDGYVGDDAVEGGEGSDVLSGGYGNDTLVGESGHDTLIGGDGDDLISGGHGIDAAEFAGSQADYQFASSSDGLTIYVTDTRNNFVDTITGVESLRFDDGNIGVSLDTNGMVLTGSNGSDSIQVVGSIPITIKAGAGDDTVEGDTIDDLIFGQDGNDTIEGNAGDDTITGGAGDDTIDGGLDDDIAIFAGNQSDYTFESSADGLTVTITDTVNNYIDTVTGVETLRFDDGDIAVSLDANGLVLTGDTTGDDITVVGSVPVTVVGVDGNDDIVGGSGNDTIEGNAGDDTITGGAGDDTIDGGLDDDIAIFAGNQSDYTFDLQLTA